MKALVLGSLLCGLMSSAIANTRDTKYITFTSAGSTTVDLSADKTHTEYRQETQARTCYRQVIVGYQTQCTPPRPDRPGQCRQYPVYRNMPYTCYVTVSVPYEVFDYKVEAKVGFELGDYALTTPMTVKVTLDGNTLSYSATGAPQHIIQRELVSGTTTVVGPELQLLDVKNNLKLHEAAPYKAALSMSKASVKKSVLTYVLGATEGLAIKHRLSLKKDPLIGSSTTLYNDVLAPAVLSREVTGAQTNYQVAFKDLIGRVLGKGRYSVDIEAGFDGEVLNDKELGGLATSKSILYKIN